MSLLQISRKMRDESTFESGRKLDHAPAVFLGAAANPFAPPHEFRADRLAKKVAAGAQFIQTQYCYDINLLKQYMQRVRDLGLDKKVYILVGVGPLASAKTAEWIRNNVPGVHIPDKVIKRLAGAADQKAEGVQLCIDMIQQASEIEGISGCHIMAYRQEHAVPEIVDRSGILSRRNSRQTPAR